MSASSMRAVALAYRTSFSVLEFVDRMEAEAMKEAVLGAMDHYFFIEPDTVEASRVVEIIGELESRGFEVVAGAEDYITEIKISW